MLICPKCRQRLQDGARFCSNCGAKFRVNPQAQPQRPPAQPMSTYQQPVQQQAFDTSPNMPPQITRFNLWRSYKLMFRNFFNFQGRTRRQDFWGAYLMCRIVILGGVMLLELFHMDGATIEVYFTLSILVHAIPEMALTVRRLHDIGKRWTAYFWGAIPIFGIVYLIVLLCRDSQPGANRFGPNPKGV